MSSLEDLIDDLEDWLDEAEGANGVNGKSGPLDDPNKSYVATRLSDSLTNITHLLSADHLDDAGTADLSDFPSTLPEIATWCHDHAVTAQGPPQPFGDNLGNLLKSIRDGINKASDGYKARASIT